MTTERIRKIRARWPDKVPCIVVYKKHEAKFIMPCEFTVAQMMIHARRRLMKMQALDRHREKALFFFHNDRLATGTTMLAELDTNRDTAVTFVCQDENVFGGSATVGASALGARCR